MTHNHCVRISVSITESDCLYILELFGDSFEFLVGESMETSKAFQYRYYFQPRLHYFTLSDTAGSRHFELNVLYVFGTCLV